MDQNELAKTCFMLGIRMAEHVHGVRRAPSDGKTDAIFDTLKEVAAGTVTMIDSTEEVIAGLPPPPAGVKANLDPRFIRDALRIGRENERIAAQTILPALPK